MGIKNYVRQVRPVQEAHVNHLDRIQSLRELTVSPDYQSRGNFNPFYVLDIDDNLGETGGAGGSGEAGSEVGSIEDGKSWFVHCIGVGL